MSEEVIEDLKRKEDGLYEWARRQVKMIVPHDAPIQEQAKLILSTHRKLIDTRRNRSGADPFVIAVAVVKRCKVVTHEDATHSDQRPQIPDVCLAYNVSCITFVEMLKEQGYVAR
jgi:hypothetical protein